MKIYVRPRYRVKHVFPGVPYVVISVTDPDPFGKPASDAEIPPHPLLRGVLALEFHDLHWLPAEREDLCPDMVEKKMQPYHADAVADFLSDRVFGTDVGAIVVHCEAGINRSTSMAKAIGDFLKLGAGDYDVAYGKMDQPATNHHVYHLTIVALNRTLKT